MKKIFRYIIVVIITLGIVIGTLYNDYKKSQAAVLPVAIWGFTESVLSLFGAFGLGVGVSNAYKDSTLVDKDAITLLQDFRGFLAKGSKLSLPYTIIEKQLNELERSLQEAQLKGYLTLVRGKALDKVSPTPDGPKRNKFENGLAESIKQYVIARHVIEHANKVDNETPINSLYDGTFYFEKLKKCINEEGYSFCQDNNSWRESAIRDYFKDVVPSDLYYYGYRIRPARYNYEGPYIEFYFPRNLSDSLQSRNFDTNTLSMFRVFLNNDAIFSKDYNLTLNSGIGDNSGLCKKDFIKSTNWKLLQDYLDSKEVNDLGTTGKITVDDKVGNIIDRDGNLDNYDIITPGTKVNPDGSVEGDITIPIPKRLPQNEPLPAGQTKPALDYGKQIDYGTGKDINGNIAIGNIPNPNPVSATGQWSAEESAANEKSKSLALLFPFCIPFDLIDAFKLLSAKPQVPKWEFDWTIPSLDFSHHFIIDLSNFNILFMVLNKLILLSFIIGLILVTRNIIRG